MNNWRRVSWHALLLAGAAGLLCAQKPGDGELFKQAQTAYLNGEFADAAIFLFAYMDRRPPAMQTDPAHAAEVRTAWKYSADMARAALHKKCEPVQQTGNLNVGTQGLSLSPPPLRPPALAPRPTYPLVCRGGGAMRFAWQPYGFGLEGGMVVLQFERGREPASTIQALAPGQCSWKDRVPSPQEPDRLCYPVSPSRFSITWGADGRTYGVASEAPAFVHSLVSSGKNSVFQVYNNGQQCLVATAFE